MKWIAFFLALFAFIGNSNAEIFRGKVTTVVDGDTIRVITAQKVEIKIRLVDIDAPEKGQPYGEKSKQGLSKLIFGQEIEVEATDKDRYGRTLATIWLYRFHNEKRNINHEMIINGDAWVYRKYAKDLLLIKLEDDAKKNKRGLWALQADQIIPPWEWRKAQLNK